MRLRDATLHPCAERPRLTACCIHLLADVRVFLAEPAQFRFRLRDDALLLQEVRFRTARRAAVHAARLLRIFQDGGEDLLFLLLDIQLAVDRLVFDFELVELRACALEFCEVDVHAELQPGFLAVQPRHRLRDGLARCVEVELQLGDVEPETQIELINFLSAFSHVTSHRR